MRGDVFRELELWDMNRVKKWTALRVVLPNVDGAIAVTDYLAEKFRDRTGTQAAAAGLAKDPGNWPTVRHTDDEIRAVTLTNANYARKIAPLIELAETVDGVLAETGGRWHICGDGDHSDRLADGVAEYEHVEYVGYVDADDELARSNLMIHASRLDGQPNAVLEGLACGLPVVTNDWVEFVRYGWPLEVCHTQSAFEDTLRWFRRPGRREQRGRQGEEHLLEHHTPKAIARDYEAFCMEVLRNG